MNEKEKFMWLNFSFFFEYTINIFRKKSAKDTNRFSSKKYLTVSLLFGHFFNFAEVFSNCFKFKIHENICL